MFTVNGMQVCLLWVNVQKVPLIVTSVEAGGYTSFIYSGGIVWMPKNYKCTLLVSFPSLQQQFMQCFLPCTSRGSTSIN